MEAVTVTEVKTRGGVCGEYLRVLLQPALPLRPLVLLRHFLRSLLLIFHELLQLRILRVFGVPLSVRADSKGT